MSNKRRFFEEPTLVYFYPMKWIWIASILLLSTSSCISKKKVRLMEQEYQYEMTVLLNTNQRLNTHISNLQQDSIYLTGSNDALLATQDKYLARLDELESELDALVSQANMTAQGKDRLIQDKEEEIKQMEDLMLNIQDLLKNRLIRLEQVAKACKIALANFDSLSWNVDYRANNCVVSLNENLLFRSWSTKEFLPAGRASLKDLAAIIIRFPDLVVDVVGHTDNQPVARTGMDNWDYSVLRASSVARLLTREYGLSTNQVLAAGKGEFSPLRSNETTEGRAENRRVDLVLRFQESDLLRELNRSLAKKGVTN